MEIEVTKPYNRFRQREDDNMRVINVWGDTYNFDILVGLTYRRPNGGDISTEIMSGGNEPLHRATVAIGVNFLGEMRMVKNRYGINGSNDEVEVRQILFDTIVSVGFSHLESSRILTEFNKCVAEITDEPVVHTKEYPYGVSRRRYMIEDSWKTWVKKYRIKRHSLI
jgi:hypothetical protein